MSITFLGILAGVLTSSSFIPQAYQIIKTKRTDGISIPIYTLFTIGILIWIIYGIMMHDLAILLTNIVTFIPALIILILTVKYHLLNKRVLLGEEE